MLIVENQKYDSWETVVFQKLSVVITELVLAYGLQRYVGPFNLAAATHSNSNSFIKDAPTSQRKLAHASALSILLSPGLLIIDHIHFQYNGFLYGVLVLSLLAARKQSTALLSGVLFAALLCLKHIYLYLAPAYFVFLLRTYCLSPRSVFRIRFANCAKLGAALVVVFGLAFGPFVYLGQTEQLLKRFFPFSRGLCHAYWAPNVWAIYSFIDRVFLLGSSTKTVHDPLH